MTDADADAIGQEAASLAAEASGGGEWSGAAEAAAEAADAAPPEKKGIAGALLHTSPDANPAAVHGPEPFGHAVVGLRKVLDARGADAGDGDGTPAIIDFARAAIGGVILIRGLSTDAADGGSSTAGDADRADQESGGDARDGPGGPPTTIGPDLGEAN